MKLSSKFNKLLLVAAAALILSACSDDVAEPILAAPEAIQMHCGQQWITVEYLEEEIVLQLGDSIMALQPAMSASGSRFESASDDDTVFWSKGNTAQLRWKGQQYPQCVVFGTLAEPFQARGNEPFWSITLHHGQLALLQPGEAEQNISANQQSMDTAGQVLIESDDKSMSALVVPGVCNDTMTGMPYPYHVAFNLAGRDLKGCGGQPEQLLQGADWQVVEILDQPPHADSRLSLTFSTDEQLSGDAGCNRFGAQYSLTGEGLDVGALITTRRACEQALMQQEQKFLDALSQVTGFDVTLDGQLWLLAAEQPVVVAQLHGKHVTRIISVMSLFDHELPKFASVVE
ncbi:MAG: META domain-containing protein [Methylophaga sp.]|nr:META domain-containing protein [Methylophaga sp.]